MSLRSIAAVMAAVITAVTLAACGQRSDTADRTMRVVCVSKQLNEFLYDIGAQRVLVARDLTSIYPPAIRSLPSVGYHRVLSAEGIISMRPTLFLTDGNLGPDAVLVQLRKVGIPIEVMRPGESLDSAQFLLRQLGGRFHRETAADSAIARWRSGLDSVWAALLGAISMEVVDVVARVIIPPAELPIGIITAVVGAPVFLWILLPEEQRGGAGFYG
ncbi:MAG TPA: iron chelate uptake ABC transporter family permease subunit [Gemmatimonadaceae bacterium]